MKHEHAYTPPAVWTWKKGNGARFSNINRPTAGSTYDEALPLGDNPFQLYSLGTPNGVKVTIMFEELIELGHSEAEYDAWLIDINKGDQFSSGFVSLNPNSKIPAMADLRNEKPIRIFESGSILLYLSRSFGEFLPDDLAEQTEVMNWLFWQAGSAPFLGGGFGHFYAYLPEKLEYPIDRYTMEVKRQLDVLDRQLAETRYIAGADYSIADISIWPWYGALAKGLLYDAGKFLQVTSYVNLRRWADNIAQRPAVQRGRMVNRLLGSPDKRLRERHDSSDFLYRTDDKFCLDDGG